MRLLCYAIANNYNDAHFGCNELLPALIQHETIYVSVVILEESNLCIDNLIEEFDSGLRIDRVLLLSRELDH